MKRAFGELELQILRILKSGKRKTVKEVQIDLGGRDNYNTVMTVMARLAEKKQLARERKGLQYEYWLLDSSDSNSFINTLKQKLFGVKASILINHLIERVDDLSEENGEGRGKMIQKATVSKK